MKTTGMIPQKIYLGLRNGFHGDKEKLEAVLAENVICVVENSEEKIEGKQEVSEWITSQNRKCYIHKGIISHKRYGSIEEDYVEGSECIILSYDDRDEYAALIFVQITEELFIKRIEISSNENLFFQVKEMDTVTYAGDDKWKEGLSIEEQLEEEIESLGEKYPPDLKELETIIKKVNINRMLSKDECLLSNLILSYSSTVQDMMPQSLKGDRDEVPDDAGKYLFDMVEMFFRNGFSLAVDKPEIGCECLANLAYSPWDKYAIDIAKYLLDKGVNLVKVSKKMVEEMQAGFKTAYSSKFTCENDYSASNYLAAICYILECAKKGKEYGGIEYYDVCLGKTLKRILKHREEDIYFFIFDEKILYMDEFDIMVNPYAFIEYQEKLEDVSGLFHNCIGKELINVRLNVEKVQMKNTEYNSPLILLVMEKLYYIQIHDRNFRIRNRERKIEVVEKVDTFARIEIIEGHDSGGYCWLQPAKVCIKERIDWDDIQELDDEISIDDIPVGCFLSYFLEKYFKRDLVYNANRVLLDYESHNHVEWNLVNNFYTYECMEKMLEEIEKAVEKLQSNQVEIIKKAYIQYFELWWKDIKDRYADEAYLEEKEVIKDFLERFIARIRKMMEDNADVDLISFMGP